MARVDLTAGAWSGSGNTHVRGYAHLDGRFLSGPGLAAAFDGAHSDAAWDATLSELNGCFAVVTQRDGRLSAAVDRLRSMPLFYGRDGGQLVVSDDAFSIPAASGGGALDPLADAEFCLTGYVTGAGTLRSGVRQIEAGTRLRADSMHADALELFRYYAFRHDESLVDDEAELIATLEQVHAGVFARLMESLGDRPIVLPLSGGYDSRLIGVSLRDLGVRNVVCYSYGVPGNWEARISQELARHLGFRWEFVTYSAERWRAWAGAGEFARYFRAAGNLASVPHVQDWPAVRELLADGRIGHGSVFVPGHSGDFLAGSHVPGAFAGRAALSRGEVLDALFEAHYSLWSWPAGREVELRRRFAERAESSAGPLGDGTRAQAADWFERWDLQERQAKFICNSLRVYESFGCEWRLPLFDHELMDFWSRVPVDSRIGRRLYLRFARERQALPVAEANTDRGPFATGLVSAMDRLGLRPVAKRMRQRLRKLRWERAYSDSPLAWFALVDRELFRRSYTGRELLHSYLALRYRDLVADSESDGGGRSPSG